MSAIGRPQNRSTELHDTSATLRIENLVLRLGEKALVAIVKSNDFPAPVGCGAHNATQYSIQTGTITAASENSDAFDHHEFLILCDP
jgi:hypothetical protein